MFKYLYLLIMSLVVAFTPVVEEITSCDVLAQTGESLKVRKYHKLENNPKYAWWCEFSQEEVELLALLTMAEAEGECELGQRLVIDTVLNRMDSEKRYFPDTITEVIYQKNAFSSMWSSRVKRCYVKEELVDLVIEELECRTNYDVLYFRTKHYSKYGTPLFKVGNHYFSG